MSCSKTKPGTLVYRALTNYQNLPMPYSEVFFSVENIENFIGKV